MNPKSPEFKKLQALWDRKLKKSGFEDIERRKDENLRSYHSLEFFNSVKRHPDKQQFKEDYYRAAGHFLHEHKFETADELKIWELHCEGQSLKHYRSRKVRCKSKVYLILNKLVKAMEDSWKK